MRQNNSGWKDYPPGNGYISPQKWRIFEDDFQFPQVGYVNFLEGILFIGGLERLSFLLGEWSLMEDIRRSPVEVGSFSHDLQGLQAIHSNIFGSLFKRHGGPGVCF